MARVVKLPTAEALQKAWAAIEAEPKKTRKRPEERLSWSKGRMLEALRLKRQGLSYKEIGEAIGRLENEETLPARDAVRLIEKAIADVREHANILRRQRRAAEREAKQQARIVQYTPGGKVMSNAQQKRLAEMIEKALVEARAAGADEEAHEAGLPDTEEMESDLKELVKIGGELRGLSDYLGAMARRHKTEEKETGLHHQLDGISTMLTLIAAACWCEPKANLMMKYLAIAGTGFAAQSRSSEAEAHAKIHRILAEGEVAYRDLFAPSLRKALEFLEDPESLQREADRIRALRG